MRNYALTATALGLFALCGITHAGPITTGQWYIFSFGGPGSSLGARPDLGVSLGLDDSPWTITLASDAILTVTDGFSPGDTFEILDFGVPQGFTSTPDGAVVSCDDFGDPFDCVASPSFSSAAYLLGAGDHSLTGAAVDSPFGSGAGFLRIDLVAMPEPGILTLFGLGLLGLAARHRRR